MKSETVFSHILSPIYCEQTVKADLLFFISQNVYFKNSAWCYLSPLHLQPLELTQKSENSLIQWQPFKTKKECISMETTEMEGCEIIVQVQHTSTFSLQREILYSHFEERNPHITALPALTVKIISITDL